MEPSCHGPAILGVGLRPPFGLFKRSGVVRNARPRSEPPLLGPRNRATLVAEAETAWCLQRSLVLTAAGHEQGDPAAAGAAKSTADAALARSVPISYGATENTPTRVVLNVGGLVIRAGCSSGPDLSIVAQTTAPLSNIHIGTISEDGISHGNGLDFWNGGDIDLAPGGADDDVQGTLTYSNGDTGTVVTVTYSMAELVADDTCQVVGNALVV